MSDSGKLGRGTLKVQVSEKVTADDLHKLLDRVLNLHGCTTCGLAGIDLHLRGDDLMHVGQLKGLTGVQSVDFMRG